MLLRRSASLALASTALIALAACSGTATDPVGGLSATSQPAPTAAPESAAPESAAPESSAPESAAPDRPSAAEMATDRLADAVLEQLKIDSPDAFSDQLITIALSPLMRQFATTADVTTRVASKGPRVTLTLSGEDSTCVITVTDEPRARGVICKAA